MVDATVTSRQLQDELQALVARNNDKVKLFNILPEEIRASMDTEVFDDIDFLLKYIRALHMILEDAAETPAGGNTFEF